MAEELNHVFFRNPEEGVVALKQKTRSPGKQQDKEEDDEDPIDYTLKQESFETSRLNFRRDRQTRVASRNPALNIPAYQEYVLMEFHSTFDSSVFAARYRNNFGLSIVSLSDLNSQAIFAIVDQARFQRFENEINIFINDVDPATQDNYHPDIKFIKVYHFLSSEKILKFEELKPHVILNVVDNVEIFQRVIRPVEESLLAYLNANNLEFYYDFQVGKIEVMYLSQTQIAEIADNFDIIQSINSLSAGVIRPNRFNMPERSFGFTITNPDEELPIIGVIDTGISNQNPLGPIIINDAQFDLTGTSPVIDNANHGTSIGALAALGSRLIPNHLGDFEADAKLLPIKIIDGNGGVIAELEVVRLIREAFDIYGVKIFTLTICYTDCKRYNEVVSEYAYAIDKLTSELNILVFIAIANNRNLTIAAGLREVVVTYPQHFENESANLCAPAESMNSLTVGALADNFENNTRLRISPAGNVPAIYSRTFHIDWNHPSITRTKLNKKLFKPDICYHGGDFDHLLDPSANGIKILSAAPGMYYDRDAGTSLATPLAANIAAKILKRYPALGDNMQTVKALIINSASVEDHKSIFNLPITRQTHVLGNGVPDVEICQFSTKDRITFILEDAITPGEIKSYPIELPEYLLELDRVTGLVAVDATLCFKFEPVKNNQVAYCPVQVAFGIFKNVPLEEYEMDENGEIRLVDDKPIALGINDNTTAHYVFSQSWSQDYYYKAKMLSNAQKIRFTISKKVLIEENRIFKIAVLSRLHKLLDQAAMVKYNRAQSFSLVITVKENPVKRQNSGLLYDEMLRINALEVINDVNNLEAEGTNEN